MNGIINAFGAACALLALAGVVAHERTSEGNFAPAPHSFGKYVEERTDRSLHEVCCAAFILAAPPRRPQEHDEDILTIRLGEPGFVPVVVLTSPNEEAAILAAIEETIDLRKTRGLPTPRIYDLRPRDSKEEAQRGGEPE